MAHIRKEMYQSVIVPPKHGPILLLPNIYWSHFLTYFERKDSGLTRKNKLFSSYFDEISAFIRIITILEGTNYATATIYELG